MNCPTTRRHLADYSAGFLAQEQARQVQAHLDGCSSCREHLQQLQQLDTMLAGDVVEPDGRAVRTALAYAREASAATRPNIWRALEAIGPLMALAALVPALIVSCALRATHYAAGAGAAHHEFMGVPLPTALLAAAVVLVTGFASWLGAWLVRDLR